MPVCSDDDSPTGPGAELVGKWVGISTTDPDPKFSSTLWTIRADGTMTLSFEVEGLTISVEGTWEIVGGKLIVVVTAGGESIQTGHEFTVRGDRLTLVDDEDGTVDIYERRS